MLLTQLANKLTFVAKLDCCKLLSKLNILCLNHIGKIVSQIDIINLYYFAEDGSTKVVNWYEFMQTFPRKITFAVITSIRSFSSCDINELPYLTYSNSC